MQRARTRKVRHLPPSLLADEAGLLTRYVLLARLLKVFGANRRGKSDLLVSVKVPSAAQPRGGADSSPLIQSAGGPPSRDE